MALIKCAECGNEISDKAAACPNCGAPVAGAASAVSFHPASHVNVTRTGAKWEGMGFVMIAFGLVSMMAGWHWGGVLLMAGFIVFLIGRFK